MIPVRKKQIYKHYKGNIYTILAVAKHTETEHALVVYEGEAGDVWARPYHMFIGNTEEGIKRFTLI
jgi:hypothetical protein